MKPAQHGGALIRQMLFDAGAEAEMRTLGVDNHRTEFGITEMLGQRSRRALQSSRHRSDLPSAG